MSTGFGVIRRGVTSIKKLAGTALVGDITLSEGAGVTLTVVGQNIAIAAVGGAGIPATTVTDETTYAAAKAVGVLTSYAREDHTHGSEPHDAHANITGITATDHHSNANDHAQQHSTTSASDHTFPGGTTTFLRADGTYAAVTATPPVLVGPNNLVSTVEVIAANTYVHVGRQLEIASTGSIEIPATSTLEVSA